jgi:hypothetical protein
MAPIFNSTFDANDSDPAHLDGSIKSLVVTDADQNPNQVLETGKDWTIELKWEIHGPGATTVGGDWHVAAFVESMGPGPEKQVGPAMTVPVSDAAVSSSRNYATTIAVPAGTLKTDGSEDGVYKLITVITHTNTGAGSTKKTRMAGFSENPLLQFYSPEV